MSGQNAMRTDQFASTNDRLDSILDALDSLATTTTATPEPVELSPSTLTPVPATDDVAPDLSGDLDRTPSPSDIIEPTAAADPVAADMPDEPVVSPPRLRVVPEMPDVPEAFDVPEMPDVPELADDSILVPPAIPKFESKLPDLPPSFDTGASNDDSHALGQFTTEAVVEAPAPTEALEGAADPVVAASDFPDLFEVPETPVVADHSVFEQPTADETPTVEAPAVVEPEMAEAQSIEAPAVEEAAVEEAAVSNHSVFEQPTAVEPATIEAVAEPVVAEAPAVAEPVVAEVPAVAEPVVAEPVVAEAPAVAEPVVAELVVAEPVAPAPIETPTVAEVPNIGMAAPVDAAPPADADASVVDAEPSEEEVTRPASIFRTQPTPAAETPQVDHSKPPVVNDDDWVSHHIIEPPVESTVFDEVPSASAAPTTPTQLAGEDLWRVDTYTDLAATDDAPPEKSLPFFADGPSPADAGGDLWQTVDGTGSMPSPDSAVPAGAAQGFDLFANTDVSAESENVAVPEWDEVPLAEDNVVAVLDPDSDVGARFPTDEDLPIPDFTGVYDETPKDSEAWNVDQAIQGSPAEGSLSQKTAMMRRNELDRLRPVAEESLIEEESEGNRKVRPVYLLVILGIALFALLLVFLADPMFLEELQSLFNEANS